jgi:murein hydrolase activator
MSLFHSPIYRKILMIALLTPVWVVTGGIQATATDESLESRMVEQQQSLHQLNRGIEEQKSRLFYSRQREIDLLTELERLQQQLADGRRQLLALQEQMETQEENLRAKQMKLDELLIEQQQLAQQVKSRLMAYYRMGDVGYLNMLFSASSLHELQDVEEYFKRLLRHDQQMIVTFHQKIAEVSAAHKELEEEKAKLAALLDDNQKQERRTAATRQQQMDFLETIKDEQKLYQLAVQEMEKDALLLTAAFDKLREESPALQLQRQSRSEKKKRAEPDAHDFTTQKGFLLPPVAGSVIISFGQEIPGRFGITTPAHGIGIKTEAGAQIRAIYQGTVAYSGYLRGYGNLLIIDHGRQYYSLMSRAALFLKEKDSEVQTGEVIGIMGDKSQLPAEGLHFEIRHGSKPENPLSWLDLTHLQFASDQEQKTAPIPPLNNENTYSPYSNN